MNEQKSISAALAGNPNVGKSTVFNALTGMHQHTGNWAGKTVSCAAGTFNVGEYSVTLTDLPGIYSLSSRSPEEEVARDFLTDTHPDTVVCVCDACCLERSLILAMQLCDIAHDVILCVNLIDEAEKKGIFIDCDTLSQMTGCTVIGAAARQKLGIDELKSAIANHHPRRDVALSGSPAERAEKIASECVSVRADCDPTVRDRRTDRVLCGRLTAAPFMLLLLSVVCWLTLSGSGVISDFLDGAFSAATLHIRAFLTAVLPEKVALLLCDGVIATVFRVIAVMLPPMSIFFPLFTLLEDLGYLPRVAFSLDRCFASCGSCGKQSLCMMMELGCNAAGVTGCRIIDSPRERNIAIITNSLVPCNGRFPTLFAVLACFGIGNIATAASMVGILILSVGMTLLVSAVLSATIFRGTPSSFTLELPPYRMPQVGRVIIRSVLDRTIFVLGRAVMFSAPAGACIWLAANIDIGGTSIYEHLTHLFDPIGRMAGMDGVWMVAFIFALPAAELILPLALAGTLRLSDTLDIAAAFAENGWGTVTAVCVIVFTLFHFPCATTLMTIKKETGSVFLTVLSAVIPTAIGYGMCALIMAVWG